MLYADDTPYCVLKGFGMVSDITFTEDDTIMVADSWQREIVAVPLLQIPYSLYIQCIQTILLHLNELPVSLLPLKLVSLFTQWTQVVKVTVKFLKKTSASVEPFYLKLKPGMEFYTICRMIHRCSDNWSDIISIYECLTRYPVPNHSVLRPEWSHLEVTFLE